MEFTHLPTPCYVVDEGKLLYNLKILKKLQDDTGCKVLLAQKAFSMFAEYGLIRDYLAGTTASSLFEARLGAEEMGGETHIFAPAYKDSEFDEIASYCGHIVFNSFTQLEKFRGRCRGASIGIRITPSIIPSKPVTGCAFITWLSILWLKIIRLTEYSCQP